MAGEADCSHLARITGKPYLETLAPLLSCPSIDPEEGSVLAHLNLILREGASSKGRRSRVGSSDHSSIVASLISQGRCSALDPKP